ncbi:MAG TPA: hypothetical protein VIK39_04245 [Candidatus Angelobacter sp.]
MRNSVRCLLAVPGLLCVVLPSPVVASGPVTGAAMLNSIASASTQQTAPPNSVILVPDNAFPGGVLTGVVLGPDDQPVPNTPVEISGGIPATLGGEVIGEPLSCPPNDPKCQPEKPSQKPGEIVPGPPVDCVSVLRKAGGDPTASTEMRKAGGDPTASTEMRKAGGDPTASTEMRKAGGDPGTTASATGLSARSGPITDAAGRFALCMLPNAPAVNLNLPGSAKVPVTAVQGQIGAPNKPPDFFQPGQKISVTGSISEPKATQEGQTWLLPAVQAWSPNRQQSITAFKTPNNLKPGPAQISYTGADGKPQQVQGTVFKIIRAFLDRAQLRSNQGATFEYDVQFAAPSGQQLCVEMHIAGPIVLTQAPAQVIPINADGLGKFSGKIRATQVTPGATVPFDLTPHIRVCVK